MSDDQKANLSTFWNTLFSFGRVRVVADDMTRPLRLIEHFPARVCATEADVTAWCGSRLNLPFFLDPVIVDDHDQPTGYASLLAATVEVRNAGDVERFRENLGALPLPPSFVIDGAVRFSLGYFVEPTSVDALYLQTAHMLKRRIGEGTATRYEPLERAIDAHILVPSERSFAVVQLPARNDGTPPGTEARRVTVESIHPERRYSLKDIASMVGAVVHEVEPEARRYARQASR